ncbi:uncharacterized protein LOC127722186 [Mytilus californianus]|uniref:uncharacterized protein LOC127722186 n=1 Tax=Mytilus californianus TaxID=6549 RepID=UPI002245BD08|nr:uncharacterized protein LOC127722186 [Mytilus californianus]
MAAVPHSPSSSSSEKSRRSGRSTASRGRKRKYFDYESDFSLGDEDIPHEINRWKSFDLDPLGIYFNRTFEDGPTCMFDVLAKSELPFEANPLAKETLDALKSKLTFDLPPLDGLPRWSMNYASSLINQLYKNTALLRQSVSTNDNMLNISLSYAIDFTQRVAFMLERLYRKKPTAKHMFSGMVGAFARMCFLQDELGNVYDSEMCLNNVDVVSRPDIRLKGTLLNTDEDDLSQQLSHLVVSVIEIKQNSDSKDPVYKHKTRSEKGCSETNEDADIHELSFLDAAVLGQHAGELLLEWEDSCFNPYMPGMIVSGTKVVMTLLHITQHHVNRLKNSWDLVPDEDKATIHYGKPLDLLVKEDRDILLETLFKLSLMNRNIDWFPG